jgi:ATP-dependent Zn protease
MMQMDGFDQTVNVKVIMATNRADTLDPALLRPGRLDRKIEFPLPDRRQKRLVFQVSYCYTKTSIGIFFMMLSIYYLVAGFFVLAHHIAPQIAICSLYRFRMFCIVISY